MHFTELIDLAAERWGGAVLSANDEFFAPKENLLKASKPVFIEDRYTDHGKWMDGWETRRRRTPGHDWCIVRLGLPGEIRGVVVDTAHFKGNYPEACSIEACSTDPASPGAEWKEILPKSPLAGDTENRFEIHAPQRATYIRLNIYPDGGVARLRVYGEVLPDWRLPRAAEIDLAAAENGGLVIDSSDMFFSSRQNLIMPGKALNMGDGWETRRRRGPGHDWCVIRLGARGVIRSIGVDTSYFKGNYPDRCSLEIADCELLPETKLRTDTVEVFEARPVGPVTQVRFNIFPDGGVARLRLFGTVTASAGLARLNASAAPDAERELLACCGCGEWARRMAAARPFHHDAHLAQVAREVWWALMAGDWLEAFRSHPRIGEKAGSRWSQQEQAGAAGASVETLSALAEANRAYEAKFGYIFIVCAAGRSAEEILAILRQRLENEPAKEILIAAEEQRRITQLRLEKWLTS